MDELLKDLEGLGLVPCGEDEARVSAGVSRPCEMCDCSIDCFPATLRYIAKKLAELGYVKKDEVKRAITFEMDQRIAFYSESVFLPRPVGEHSPTFDGCAGRTMRAMLPHVRDGLLRMVDGLGEAE